MTIAYAATATIALLLLAGYLIAVRPKERWLTLLFICIPLVNFGYLMLSIAENIHHLPFANFANTVVYLGSVFLTPCLFMTVLRLCNARRRPYLKRGVIGLAVLMFAAVATTSLTKLYYQEVFFDGDSLFSKTYGPLHPFYTIYVVGYFVAMMVTVIRSLRGQRFPSQKQAVLITAIVFGNVVLWLLERLLPGPFEYMSVFYLFSEVMLLGLHWLALDAVAHVTEETSPTTPMEHLLAHLPEGVTLHPREQEILELILANEKRKEIAAKLCLSENTVKTYTRNLYRKLNVSSREELYALLPQNA